MLNLRGGSSLGRFTVSVLALLSTLVLLNLCEAAVASAELRISQAEWKAEGDGHEVTVRGRADAGATVTITDSATQAHLGTVVARDRGYWKLELKFDRPDEGPCNVTAESRGEVAQRNVDNAPAECGAAQAPAATLVSISINGPSSLSENSGAQYTGWANYSDGSTTNITNDANWFVSSTQSSLPAAIISPGYLEAGEVSADQTVTLTSVYAFNGDNHTASTTISITDANGAPGAPGEPGGPETVTGSHEGRFDMYKGTQTCLECHDNEARDVHASIHYQWQGDASEAFGLTTSTAGKLGGINDFCIYPDINWIGKLTNVDGVQVDGGCAKCHAGMGAKPTAEATQEQLENIDCLVCHSDSYKRTVANVNGSFRFVPDTSKMTVSVLQAAVDITLPSKDSCLNCHTKAGGGNNFKRGDIEEEHRNPTRDFDVHMASITEGGAGLTCTDCHNTLDHKIAGRGTDLRPRENNDADVSCEKCHTARPHNNSRIDKHIARVNCTVCHIPEFAKVAPTDMERNWSLPGDLVQATGLYEPHITKGQNVVPVYRFFNGNSQFYQFGDPAIEGPDGRIVMSAPLGDIKDAGARIYAFKHHKGIQPIDPVTQRLMPLKIGKFFMTGQIDQPVPANQPNATAVRQGAAEVGWEYNGHDFAQTERYLGLFHEVAPKEQALNCNSCHGGQRLDFAALGYTPNTTRNGRPLCTSCHSDESGEWSQSEFFTKVHAKHVDDKGYDCSRCHTFTAAN